MISRAEALQQMDIRETEKREPLYFSLQFYTKSGEVITLQRAKAAGLRMNMKEKRMRGAQPVDENGNAIGHVYPVCIDNIREFNKQRVKI